MGIPYEEFCKIYEAYKQRLKSCGDARVGECRLCRQPIAYDDRAGYIMISRCVGRFIVRREHRFNLGKHWFVYSVFERREAWPAGSFMNLVDFDGSAWHEYADRRWSDEMIAANKTLLRQGARSDTMDALWKSTLEEDIYPECYNAIREAFPEAGSKKAIERHGHIEQPLGRIPKQIDMFRLPPFVSRKPPHKRNDWDKKALKRADLGDF